MAPIFRQSWDQMRDEVLLRMGKQNVAAWSPRIERFITAAYYDIALTWHFYQLEDEITGTLLEDSGVIILRFASPPAIYSIMAVRIRDSANKIFQLSQEHIKFTFQERRAPGRPEKWARTSPSPDLLLDRQADQEYEADVYCYRYPVAPDFDPAASGSQLEELWDEHIMQRAMFLAAPATWRYDMSQVQVQTLQEFLQAQPQAPTKGTLVSRAEAPLTSQNQGGSQ